MTGYRLYLEPFWDFLYKDIFKEDDYLISYVGSTLWLGFIYYGLCGFFTYVDVTGRPKFMLKYKIQPGTNDPLDTAKLWKTIKLATFNQVVVSGPWMLLVYYLHDYRGSSCKTEDLPTLVTIIRDLAVSYLVQLVLFYYLHRLFHWGPLYRHVHKIHHEWRSPALGLVAVYAHPLEHLIVNLPAFTLGPIIMGSHRFTVLLWYTYAMLETIISHSGYHLPFCISSQYHDFHHFNFNCNYGGSEMIDWLHGTCKPYQGTIQQKRDRIIWGFTPISEQYPDPKQK